MKYFKIITLSLIAIFALVVAQVAAQEPQLISEPTAAAYPTYAGKGISLTATELIKAGFAEVKPITATADRYVTTANYYPIFYFKVKESVAEAQGQAWGEGANTVSVLIRQMPTAWTLNNGQNLIKDIAGKTQVSASKPGYYFVITGPDQENTAKLIEEIKNLY